MMRARSSPAGLAKYATEGRWRCYSYLRLLDSHLVAAAFGRCKWLIVNMPPRHGKSTLVSRYFPAWFTGLFPDRRVLLASYESNFAASWGLAAKDEAERLGARLFGVRVRRDVSAASNWRYRGHEGGMSTAGVGGPFTGKGGNVLIVDDPIKNPEEARSPARRQQIWDWFLAVALTRLEPQGAVIVIQTRWNEDDLTGRILKEFRHEDLKVLSFPAIAEDGDPLGRAKGEALCPERFDESAIAGIRKALGQYWFSALYQQRPRPEDGSVFKESWFPRFSGEPPGQLLRRTQILDSAHKTKKENDYSCIVTIDLMDSGTYLRHVWREKVTYPDLKHRTQDLVAEWGANEICIEDKDAGAMLIQELQRDTQLPVIAMKTDRDKVARAHAATPLCEAGRVFLPNNDEAPWLGDFLSELLAFPNAEHDDQVDAFVHGLNRLKEIGPFQLRAEDFIVDTGRRMIDWDLEFAL